MSVTYDKHGPPFQRVTAVQQPGASPLDLTDTTACHKVGTNYYLGMMLASLHAVTNGALSITPKEQDCQTPIGDLAQHFVDRDPTTPGIQELKMWQALVGFLSQQADRDGNGIPDVPARYAELQHRIVSE